MTEFNNEFEKYFFDKVNRCITDIGKRMLKDVFMEFSNNSNNMNYTQFQNLFLKANPTQPVPMNEDIFTDMHPTKTVSLENFQKLYEIGLLENYEEALKSIKSEFNNLNVDINFYINENNKNNENNNVGNKNNDNNANNKEIVGNNPETDSTTTTTIKTVAINRAASPGSSLQRDIVAIDNTATKVVAITGTASPDNSNLQHDISDNENTNIPILNNNNNNNYNNVNNDISAIKNDTKLMAAGITEDICLQNDDVVDNIAINDEIAPTTTTTTTTTTATTAIIDDHTFENDIAMDCDNNEANENMIVDEEDGIYSPEKNLLFTFNFNNIDQRVRVASKELIRVYQRENPGAKWAENLHAECNRHVTESRYQVSFRNSKDVLWIHGNADAIKLKKEITLKKSWFISAWVLADDFLLGFDKRSSQKWRTLCSCAVGNEKKYASYHIMLTSFKKDIFIGPYISVPNEGTEKYNGDGIFLPCHDSEGNDVNFYNVLKHGEFNHIAVHGEASVIENGKTIPGWTTVYINGNKVGEVEGVVDLPIQVIGQCASKTKARYGIQRMVDFRVYQMPQEVSLISPSPAVQSVLSHSMVQLDEYPDLPETDSWKETEKSKILMTFDPSVGNSSSKSYRINVEEYEKSLAAREALLMEYEKNNKKKSEEDRKRIAEERKKLKEERKEQSENRLMAKEETLVRRRIKFLIAEKRKLEAIKKRAEIVRRREEAARRKKEAMETNLMRKEDHLQAIKRLRKQKEEEKRRMEKRIAEEKKRVERRKAEEKKRAERQRESNELQLMILEEKSSKKYERMLKREMEESYRKEKEVQSKTFKKTAIEAKEILKETMEMIFTLEYEEFDKINNKYSDVNSQSSFAIKPYMEKLKFTNTVDGYKKFCHGLVQFEFEVNAILLDLIVKDYTDINVRTYVEKQYPIRDFFIAKNFCSAARQEWFRLNETKCICISNKDPEKGALFNIDANELEWESDSCAICEKLQSPYQRNQDDDVEEMVRCDGCIFSYHICCMKFINGKKFDPMGDEIFHCPICEASNDLRNSVLQNDVQKTVSSLLDDRFANPFWQPVISSLNFERDMNAIQIASSDGQVEILQMLLAPFIDSQYRSNDNLYELPPSLFFSLNTWREGNCIDIAKGKGHVEMLLQLSSRGAPVTQKCLQETRLRRAELNRNNNVDFGQGLELNKLNWEDMQDNKDVVFINHNIESKTVFSELKKIRACKCDENSNGGKGCLPIYLPEMEKKYISSRGETNSYPLHPNQNGVYVECNYNCPCSKYVVNRRNSAASTWADCGRRQLQQGCRYALDIIKLEDGRGYGVKTLQNIKKGAFVTEYIGEIISTEENLAREKAAMQRGDSSSFYTWDLGKKFVIDATKYRNVGSLINHRCKRGNLVPAKVMVHRQRPRMAFFARRDIEKGEELTINYWTGVKKSKKTGFGAYCLCVDCVKKRKKREREATNDGSSNSSSNSNSSGSSIENPMIIDGEHDDEEHVRSISRNSNSSMSSSSSGSSTDDEVKHLNKKSRLE